ncbi:MAG TPA: competence/damage-inducible protein A [Verrucomicrobiae bacterium]|jgi:nicotinamide-nucleotide amidase
MSVELINTGTELLLGRVLNTHQQWLCRQLADLGYEVSRQTCVADQPRQIEAAVRESLARARLVIVTGGLGPTSDDITRDLIAAMLGRELVCDHATLAHIEKFFSARHRAMPENVKVQAMIPAGARILANPNGTAPGLAIEARPNPFDAAGRTALLILLPGPPRELRPMFTDSVIPLLAREFPPPETLVSVTLKTTGMGESMVEERIAGPLSALVQGRLELGYCARIGEVEVRLSARGSEAAKTVQQAESIVRQRLGGIIFGMGDEIIESVVVRMLTERSRTLGLAESCTGGMAAHRLTNVPGASAVLKCGLVTYSNEAKREFLGVTAATLEEHGAVSEVVARQMAEGARRRCGTDYAISITGIAGPSGGAEGKPVGTVFIALADASGASAKKYFNPFDRETFKYVTSQQALDMLRNAMLK